MEGGELPQESEEDDNDDDAPHLPHMNEGKKKVFRKRIIRDIAKVLAISERNLHCCLFYYLLPLASMYY